MEQALERRSGVRFLVTGCLGFIGRRLVDRLVSRFGPRSTVCLTRGPSTPTEARALSVQRALGLRVIEADLLDDPVSADRPPRACVVFHLAANVETAASERQLRVNDVGTEHLLRWFLPDAPPARVVYASTVAVHDRDRRPLLPLCETSPCVPRTAYGRTKLRGEMIVRSFCAVNATAWTILRLATVYGPGQKPTGLFETLARLAARRAWLCRLDWTGRTSVIHVDDAVEAMIELGLRPEAAGQVYAVASGESPTVAEIARWIGEVTGHPVEPLALPPPFWRLLRRLAWSRAVQAFVPRFAFAAYWRLSLMVDDGFWMDASRFRRAYTKPIRTLREGLMQTFVELAAG
jgi:UDP-glucose 4-epimerase